MGLLALLGVCGSSTPRIARAQIHRLAEMNTEQIRAFDRQRTVVVIPGGVLEEHGPYLPSFTDGYFNERMSADLANAIVARPGWSVVLFPIIPLGVGGANEIGGRYSFPGTYSVRPTVMRAVFMDLATELGEQGFRWIFVVHAHGGPNHNWALDEAGDFFRDTYGGRMVHLFGIILPESPADSIMRAMMPRDVLAEDGFTVHAGLGEQSALMALRPDLVPAAVAGAPSVTGRDHPDLRRIAALPEWPGYFGTPRYATAELGRRIVDAESRQFVELALRILDGFDERQLLRISVQRRRAPSPAIVMRAAAARDSVLGERQRAWIDRRPRP